MFIIHFGKISLSLLTHTPPETHHITAFIFNSPIYIITLKKRGELKFSSFPSLSLFFSATGWKVTFLLTHPGPRIFFSLFWFIIHLPFSIFILNLPSIVHFRSKTHLTRKTFPANKSENEWNEVNWWTSRRVYTFSLPCWDSFKCHFVRVKFFKPSNEVEWKRKIMKEEVSLHFTLIIPPRFLWFPQFINLFSSADLRAGLI